MIGRWTHVLFDVETGDVIGMARDLEYLERGLFGTAVFFGRPGFIPQYGRLEDFEVLSLEAADADVRDEAQYLLEAV